MRIRPKRKKKAATVCLLGPQRLEPTLDAALQSHGVSGQLAVVTAGWEEREAEIEELSEHVGRAVVNLGVYERVEDIFERDPELLTEMRKRHDRLRALQDLYRVRLGYALEAARTMLGRDEDPALLAPEQEAAIAAVRELDDQHLERIREIVAEFQGRVRPAERDHVVRHKREITSILADSSALCVAGGHVAILLNRMRLLDVVGAAEGLPIFAWSAGAMVLGERIVLFHDSPPQGPGDAEVLEAGLGVCPDVVPLPHASRRLRLEDPTRVALFARRFAGSLCVALDEGTRLDWDGDSYRGRPGTTHLTAKGAVEEVEAA